MDRDEFIARLDAAVERRVAEHAEIVSGVRLPEEVRSAAVVHLAHALIGSERDIASTSVSAPPIALIESGYRYAETTQLFGVFLGDASERIEAVAHAFAGDPHEDGELLARLVLAEASSDERTRLVLNAELTPFESLDEAFESNERLLRDILGFEAATWPTREVLWAAFQLGAILFAVEVATIKARLATQEQPRRRRWWSRRR